jgi:predicted transglutaminase-like cysteine proteinase
LVLQWQDLSEKRFHSESLNVVNDFVNNNIRYASDLSLYGVEDYWATPKETLLKGQGDCEDFAILKYATLVKMGVPSSDLRLIMTRHHGEMHIVLGYYRNDNDPLILDDVTNRILPLSKRNDLVALFSFNSEVIYTPRGLESFSPFERLGRWRGVVQRMADEGSYSLPVTLASL